MKSLLWIQLRLGFNSSNIHTFIYQWTHLASSSVKCWVRPLPSFLPQHPTNTLLDQPSTRSTTPCVVWDKFHNPQSFNPLTCIVSGLEWDQCDLRLPCSSDILWAWGEECGSLVTKIGCSCANQRYWINTSLLGRGRRGRAKVKNNPTGFAERSIKTSAPRADPSDRAAATSQASAVSEDSSVSLCK